MDEKSMSNRLYTVATTRDRFVDKETGEILDDSIIEKKQILISDEKTFFQFYYAIEAYIWDLTSMERDVFMALCLKANKENKVYPVTAIKEEIAIKINMSKTGDRKSSVSSVSKAILHLTSKELLTKLSPSEYLINPRFVWSYTAKSREFSIKTEIENGRI
jgi:hypothetical protein